MIRASSRKGGISAWGLAAASIVRIAVQSLIFPFVGRQIGPEGVGQIALVTPFVFLAMMFSEAGLGTAIIRARDVTEEFVGTVFACSIIMSCGIVGAFAFVAEPLANFFNAPQFAGLLLGMSATLILASINMVPASLLLRDNRYGAVAASDAVSTLIGLLAVLVGLSLGWGIYSLVVQQVLSWSSRALFGAIAARWRPSFAFRLDLLSEHVGLSMNLTSASVLAFIGKNADSMLLAWFFGEKSLGFYALAFQFVTIPQMVTSGSTYLTALGRTSEAERLQQSAADIYLAALRSTLLVCTPIVAGMALVAPLAIPAILGPSWQPAAILVILLAPYGFAETLWPSLSGIARGHGRGRLILGLSLYNGLVTTIAIVVTARFGSAAVAAAVSGSAIIGLLLGLVLINRLYGLALGRVARLFVPPAVASAAMIAVVLAVLPPTTAIDDPIVRLVLEILLGAVIYAVTLTPFHRHYGAELGLVRSGLARLARSGRPDVRPSAIKTEYAAPVVVVATRGRADILARTIAHIRKQTFAPAQIIISCSTEADVGLVATWPDVTVVYGPSGSTCQRNRALQVMPETDIVVFFDDDFVPHDNWLAAAVEAFHAHPDVAIVTGDLVADGIKGPGVAFDDAVTMLERVAAPLPGWVREDRSPYGCNMAFRADVVRAVGFDERLTHYGWLDDADIGGAIQNQGWRSIQIGSATGVHMGVKSGRTPGHLLGYSQIVNPLYLYRKKTLTFKDAFSVLARNLLSNIVGSVVRDPHIDRRGRLKGNLLAFRLLLLGRLSPEHQSVGKWSSTVGIV